MSLRPLALWLRAAARPSPWTRGYLPALRVGLKSGSRAQQHPPCCADRGLRDRRGSSGWEASVVTPFLDSRNATTRHGVLKTDVALSTRWRLSRGHPGPASPALRLSPSPVPHRHAPPLCGRCGAAVRAHWAHRARRAHRAAVCSRRQRPLRSWLRYRTALEDLQGSEGDSPRALRSPRRQCHRGGKFLPRGSSFPCAAALPREERFRSASGRGG